MSPLKNQEIQFNIPPANITYSVSIASKLAELTHVLLFVYVSDGRDGQNRVHGLL